MIVIQINTQQQFFLNFHFVSEITVQARTFQTFKIKKKIIAKAISRFLLQIFRNKVEIKKRAKVLTQYYWHTCPQTTEKG